MERGLVLGRGRGFVDAFGCRVGLLKIDHRRRSRAVNLSREEAPG